MARVDVYGDLPWLNLFQRNPDLKELGVEGLLNYRRVSRSASYTLPGGAWLVSQFVRAAIGDVSRKPLLWRGGLTDWKIRLRDAGSRRLHLKLATASDDQRLTLEIPADEVEIELSDDPARAQFGHLVVSVKTRPDSISPSAIKAFPSKKPVWFGFSTETESTSTTRAPERFVEIDFIKQEIVREPVPFRLTFCSPFWQQLPPAIIDREKYRIHVASEVAMYPVEPIEMEDDDTGSEEVFGDLPLSATVTVSSPVKGLLKRKIVTDAFLGLTRLGAATLIWPHSDPGDQSLRDLFSLWKDASLRTPTQHHVRTYGLEATPTIKAWWQVNLPDWDSQPFKRRKIKRSTRLVEVLGHDYNGDLTCAHWHGAAPLEAVPPDDEKRPDHLVFCDLNYGFRRSDERVFVDERFERELSTFLDAPESIIPVTGSTFTTLSGRPDWIDAIEDWKPNARKGLILIDLGRSLPLGDPDETGLQDWDRSDLWAFLRKSVVREAGHNDLRLASRVVVITSAHLLRAGGARISHRLSWEHAIEDCWYALAKNPQLAPLLDFANVVVRFGCVGSVVVTSRPTRTGDIERTARVLIDANARDYYRNPDEDGRVLGSNSVVIGSILRELLPSTSPLTDEHITETVVAGVRTSFARQQDLDRLGYGTFDGAASLQHELTTLSERTESALSPLKYEAPLKVFCEETPSPKDLCNVNYSGTQGWQIVDSYAEEELIDAAVAFVIDGTEGSQS